MEEYINKAELLKELSIIQDRPVSTAMKIIKEFSTIDLVRCGECKWYEPRHIEENGIECAGQCIWHIGLKTYCDAHDRENPEDRPKMIIFREPTDFCSYGERKE